MERDLVHISHPETDFERIFFFFFFADGGDRAPLEPALIPRAPTKPDK